MTRTKIIATLGPASGSAGIIRRMMLSGLDVVRINFSHGKPQDYTRWVQSIRLINRKYRRRIRILGDLEGYRIRIGALRRPLELKKRQQFILTNRPGRAGGPHIPFDYTGNLRDIGIGQTIFIDDGTIALTVTGRTATGLQVRVEVPGILKSHKGINIPDAKLRFSGLTERDKRHILFSQEHHFDYIAQSFVRGAGDITAIRRFMGSGAVTPQLVAKIENEDGIHTIHEIMKVSDGIMIARGDLGVSVSLCRVPLIQKDLIRQCNRAKKFCITATQMMESMTEQRRPTRAEVSDVANAILDGTDFVMLSAETAVGKYPVETVRMMNEVIRCTEAYQKQDGKKACRD